jgi:hypothetical protein
MASPAEIAVPVTVQGLTPSGAGTWALVVMVLVALIRAWPVLKKLANESDASFRADMLKQTADLRSEVIAARRETAEERRRCDEVMHDMRLEYDNTIREMRIQIEGLHRQIVMQSAHGVRMAAGQSVSQVVLDAADRSVRAVQERDGGEE